MGFSDSPEDVSQQKYLAYRLIPFDANGTPLVEKASNTIVITIEGTTVSTDPPQEGLTISNGSETETDGPGLSDEVLPSGGSDCSVNSGDLSTTSLVGWTLIAVALWWNRRRAMTVR